MLKAKSIYLLLFVTCVCLNMNAAEEKLIYGRFSASYTNVKYSLDLNLETTLPVSLSAADNTHGASIDAAVGRIFNAKAPVFGEIGLGITYVSSQDSEEIEGIREGYEIVDNFQVLSFAIPVNIGYKIRCSKTVTIDPYVGLNFKLNAMCREKLSYNQKYLQDHPSVEDDIRWTNLLSDCPSCGAGSKDLCWKKFQIGWHVGIGFNIKRFYIGASYGTDFIDAWNYDDNTVKTSTIKASLGFTI